MIVVEALLAVLISLPVATGILYFGVPLSARHAQITPHEAVAVSVVGVFTSGVGVLLFGWVPVLGVVLAPLVWVGVVGYFCRVTWPAAVVIGLLSWAIPGVLNRLALLI